MSRTNKDASPTDDRAVGFTPPVVPRTLEETLASAGAQTGNPEKNQSMREGTNTMDPRRQLSSDDSRNEDDHNGQTCSPKRVARNNGQPLRNIDVAHGQTTPAAKN